MIKTEDVFMKKKAFLFFVILSVSLASFSLDPVEIYRRPWEEMTREQRREFWLRRTIQQYEPSGKPSKDKLDFYISIFESKNVFDPKVTVFEVNAEDKEGTITLTGEVLIPNHKGGVERVLNILGFDKIENNINVLPDPGLGKKGFAVALSPVVSIKRRPSEHSEQMNQLEKGAPLRLLKKDETGQFYLAQSPDAYVGWVDAKDIQIMELKQWSLLRKPKGDDSLIKEKIIKITKPIMGIPYIWGGTTEQGVDCSGLTQYIYKELGINLPRDADEQSNIGEIVAFPGYRDNLRAGDLLLFTGRSGRFSHVAISLGGMDYLQSAGKDGVHLSSFDPASPHYDKRTDEKFVFARRVLRTNEPLK